ncbi:hypothetical protein DYH09_34160 [bacterium CPR1]|nr:hypothetical protein [bacterium CPR1]
MLACLRQGRVVHEGRSLQGTKNLLSSGEVSETEALRILEAVRGQQAQQGVHHYEPEQPIWIMRPEVGGVRWYLKLYLSGENLVCLSFHRAEEQK